MFGTEDETTPIIEIFRPRRDFSSGSTSSSSGRCRVDGSAHAGQPRPARLRRSGNRCQRRRDCSTFATSPTIRDGCWTTRCLAGTDMPAAEGLAAEPLRPVIGFESVPAIRTLIDAALWASRVNLDVVDPSVREPFHSRRPRPRRHASSDDRQRPTGWWPSGRSHLGLHRRSLDPPNRSRRR